MLNTNMTRRDYSKARYVSMRQQKMELKRQDKKSFGKTVIFLLIPIIIIAIIYGLFFSRMFEIQKIIITGTDRVEETTKIEEVIKGLIEQKRFFVLPQRNIFLLSKSAVQSVVVKIFDLEEVRVEAQGAHTLKVQIKHKTPAVIWSNGNQEYFTVYSDGVIKNKIDADRFELPIVSRGTTTVVVIGQKIIDQPHLKYILELYSLFNFYLKGFSIKEFIIPYIESREVKLITSEGWYILFSLENDVRQCLESIKLVLDQKIPNRAGLQYIDARIKGKIYYR